AAALAVIEPLPFWLSPDLPLLQRSDLLPVLQLVAPGLTIRHAVREASPDLGERKRGHALDYVQRTVEVAVRFQRRQRLEPRPRKERDGGAVTPVHPLTPPPLHPGSLGLALRRRLPRGHDTSSRLERLWPHGRP